MGPEETIYLRSTTIFVQLERRFLSDASWPVAALFLVLTQRVGISLILCRPGRRPGTLSLVLGRRRFFSHYEYEQRSARTLRW